MCFLRDEEKVMFKKKGEDSYMNRLRSFLRDEEKVMLEKKSERSATGIQIATIAAHCVVSQVSHAPPIICLVCLTHVIGNSSKLIWI